MIFVSMMLGCSAFGGTQNETKLTVAEGIGVIGTLNIEEMHPGLDGYISLTVRGNLGGETASNVRASLDNVEPFQIFECGRFVNNSSRIRTEDNCAGAFSMDKNLPYRTHGESKMFPGEELEFFWRLRAPSKDDISNIALKHPIYYDLEYDYKTTFVQNIIFMSQQELLKRRQSGEAYEVEGEASSGAGELRVTGITRQPVVYFFNDPDNRGSPESNFSFDIQYSVKNEGKGIPLSDVVVMIEIPRGKLAPANLRSTQLDIEPNYATMGAYGWKEYAKWDGKLSFVTSQPNVIPPAECSQTHDPSKVAYTYACDCSTGSGSKNCKEWIQSAYPSNEFNDNFALAISENRLLVKVVKRTDFIDQFSIYLPLNIVGDDPARGMEALKSQQIPIGIYGFKVHNIYRYFTEGQAEIIVYPVRI